MNATAQIISLKAQIKELSRQLDSELEYFKMAKQNKDQPMMLRAQEAAYKIEGDIYQFNDIIATLQKAA